jgi:hypothetical protein
MDRTILGRVAWALAAILLIGAGLAYHRYRSKQEIVILVNDEDELVTGARIIDRILMRRAEAIDYASYCPDLPFRMYRIQKIMGIDIRVLPTIADVEGGTVTPAMQRAKNLCGMSVDERLIVYDDWDYAIYKTCVLVRNINTNDISRLAERWCPLNKYQWEENFSIVYRWSVKQESVKKYK